MKSGELLFVRSSVRFYFSILAKHQINNDYLGPVLYWDTPLVYLEHASATDFVRVLATCGVGFVYFPGLKRASEVGASFRAM